MCIDVTCLFQNHLGYSERKYVLDFFAMGHADEDLSYDLQSMRIISRGTDVSSMTTVNSVRQQNISSR
jgi:hypothetical protein